MLERVFDEESGVIPVKASGEWTASEVDDHFRKLGIMIADVRRKKILVRVLVDVRDAPDRSALIEARINSRKKGALPAGRPDRHRH